MNILWIITIVIALALLWLYLSIRKINQKVYSLFGKVDLLIVRDKYGDRKD